MALAGLLVAAGRGSRLGGMPKQYRRLGRETVLARAARALLVEPALDRLVVVIHPDDRPLYEAAIARIDDPRLAGPVAGGATRAQSVLRGLEALEPFRPDRVLIHDAARPFLGADCLARVLAALDAADGAFPALAVVDALWRAEAGEATAPVARDDLWRAQTPQAFRFAAILAAHRLRAAKGGEAADDVAVAREAGLTVRIVPGEERNFKVTTPDDLARAERIAAEEDGMDVRTGSGFDVHAFGPGDHVTLCGVRLAHDRGLVGHSDADVGMHALTDAILGALAEGDIGRWFPPGEPAWKGAASEIFLARVMARAAERGFALTHCDVTLICERPKIGPHAEAMRAELARILKTGIDRVSVKATTSERLGFTGREEGIAALATATLVRA